MIYICCLDPVDAVAYASRLSIRLRQQQGEARIVQNLQSTPMRCEGLDIRATPEFWTALTHPSVDEGNISRFDLRAHRNVAARVARDISMARAIGTAVRLRGGRIKAPYDVPPAMDAASVEAWLDSDEE